MPGSTESIDLTLNTQVSDASSDTTVEEIELTEITCGPKVSMHKGKLAKLKPRTVTIQRAGENRPYENDYYVRTGTLNYSDDKGNKSAGWLLYKEWHVMSDGQLKDVLQVEDGIMYIYYPVDFETWTEYDAKDRFAYDPINDIIIAHDEYASLPNEEVVDLIHKEEGPPKKRQKKE